MGYALKYELSECPCFQLILVAASTKAVLRPVPGQGSHEQPLKDVVALAPWQPVQGLPASSQLKGWRGLNLSSIWGLFFPLLIFVFRLVFNRTFNLFRRCDYALVTFGNGKDLESFEGIHYGVINLRWKYVFVSLPGISASKLLLENLLFQSALLMQGWVVLRSPHSSLRKTIIIPDVSLSQSFLITKRKRRDWSSTFEGLSYHWTDFINKHGDFVSDFVLSSSSSVDFSSMPAFHIYKLPLQKPRIPHLRWDACILSVLDREECIPQLHLHPGFLQDKGGFRHKD